MRGHGTLYAKLALMKKDDEISKERTRFERVFRRLRSGRCADQHELWQHALYVSRVRVREFCSMGETPRMRMRVGD